MMILLSVVFGLIPLAGIAWILKQGSIALQSTDFSHRSSY